MNDLIRELPHDFSILVNTSIDTHIEAYKILEHLHHSGGICITLNRPARNLKKLLDIHNIKNNHLYFIDCISRRISHQQKMEKCTYLSSPDLTEIGLAVDSLAKSIPGKKFLILDSLSTLRLYHSKETIELFLNFFINRMRVLNINPIVLNEKQELALGHHYFDRIIDI